MINPVHEEGTLPKALVARLPLDPNEERAVRKLPGALGAAMQAAATGNPLRTQGDITRRVLRLQRSPKPGHLLGITEFLTQLTAAARRTPGATLAQWWPETTAAQACGDIVRPDAYAEWHETGTRTIGFFYEHDTGTENLATLIGKIDRYTALTAAWISRPVLVELPNPARETHLHHAITRKYGPHRPRAVLIATTTIEHTTSTPRPPPDPKPAPSPRRGQLAALPRPRRAQLPDVTRRPTPHPGQRAPTQSAIDQCALPARHHSVHPGPRRRHTRAAVRAARQPHHPPCATVTSKHPDGSSWLQMTRHQLRLPDAVAALLHPPRQHGTGASMLALGPPTPTRGSSTADYLGAFLSCRGDTRERRRASGSNPLVSFLGRGGLSVNAVRDAFQQWAPQMWMGVSPTSGANRAARRAVCAGS